MQAEATAEDVAVRWFKRCMTRWTDLVAKIRLKPHEFFRKPADETEFAPWLYAMLEECAPGDVDDPKNQCEIVVHRLPRGQFNEGAPASWLWQHGPDGKFPRIVIDEEAMRSVLGRRGRQLPKHEAYRLKTRLVMHEIAHLDLHWSALRKKGHGDTEVSPSSPEQEREAWLCAGFIVTLALGDYARHVRTPTANGRTRHDDTWVHL
jgi:hypothetical protein